MEEFGISTIICGTLRLSNGQVPDIFIDWPGKIKTDKDDEIGFRCKILSGHIIVEYFHSLKDEDIDEVFRMTRHLVDYTILTKILFERIGLLYTLETCKRDTGEIVNAIPDRAPAVEDIQISFSDVLNLIGADHRLRYALKDFNQGLITREDCPFYFYRSIETLAKAVCKKDKINRKDWNEFHLKVGTTKKDMDLLLSFNLEHRHGTHLEFNKDQHLKMMKTVNYFITSTLRYFLKNDIEMK
jgi:hypothetical protein